MTVKSSKSRKPAAVNAQDNSEPGKSCAPDDRLALLEKELDTTRNEFESLLENSLDAIRIIDVNFTVRRINKAFADITSADQGNVTGKKCWDVFPSPLCHTPECRLQRILNGEKYIQVEIERKKKDGTVFPA
jgi:PAS domain S-box-containing protein